MLKILIFNQTTNLEEHFIAVGLTKLSSMQAWDIYYIFW